MSFTDEDLKRLKEELIGHDPRLVTPLKREYPQFESLLARLEAAERICFWIQAYGNSRTSRRKLLRNAFQEIEAWLKSKGE